MHKISAQRIGCSILLLVAWLALSSCSSGDSSSEAKSSKEPQHVWRDQTDMLDKARGVESQILNEAQRRQNDIDQQAR